MTEKSEAVKRAEHVVGSIAGVWKANDGPYVRNVLLARIAEELEGINRALRERNAEQVRTTDASADGGEV